MKKLKITKEIISELNSKGIVICTYIDSKNKEVDCIDIIYQDQYLNLEVIDVVDTE